MSKTNWIILIIVVLVIAAAAFYFLKSSNTPVVTMPAPAPANTQTNAPAPQAPSPAVQGKIQNVAIVNFSFNPATLNISKGDTVVWTNQDSAPHHILGTGFESTDLGKNGTYGFTFNTAGTFNYHCVIHPYMQGEIIVK